MKKANFNALKNLPTPKGWVEKALAIPEQEHKAVVPFWRRSGVIALAASLVLVSAVTIALFLNIGGKPPITVKPSSTEVVWSTDANGETIATEVVTVPSYNGQQNDAQPTEPKTALQRVIDSIFGTPSRTFPTTAGNQSGKKPSATQNNATEPKSQNATEKSLIPTVPEAPTEIETPPTETPQVPPTVKPWVPSTTAPTERSTTSPWDKPTELAWENPTETPSPHDPTEPLVQPTAPPPTEDPDAWLYCDSLTNLIPAGNVPEDSTLYICFIDGHGNLLGNPDLYSAEHLVTVNYRYSNYISVSYTTKDRSVLPQRGLYRYYFYTEDGKTVYYGRSWLNA